MVLLCYLGTNLILTIENVKGSLLFESIEYDKIATSG